MSESPWTEERVALLRRLKAQGVSNPKIAKALTLTGHKFSRNAVGAKCDRLGIESPETNLSRAQLAAARGKSAPPMMVVSNTRETGAPRGPHNVPFKDRDESACLLFVGGESRETGLICGRPREEGKPYCSQCRRIAYLPPEPMRRKVG